MRAIALALLVVALSACAKQGSESKAASPGHPNAEATLVYFAMPG